MVGDPARPTVRSVPPLRPLLHLERAVRQRSGGPEGLVEGDGQRRAGDRRARHRRAHPVHLVAAERIDGHALELSERRLVPRRVRDLAAVPRHRIPDEGNAVGVRIARRHRVAEHQRIRAAARVVHRIHQIVFPANADKDARPRHRIAGRGHRHRLGERHRHIDRVADRVGAVRTRRRGHRDRIGLDQRRRDSVHLVARVVVHLGKGQERVHLRPRHADAGVRSHAQLVRVERDALRREVIGLHGPGELERRRVRPAPTGVEGHGFLAGLRIEPQLQHRAAHHVHRAVERHPRAHHVTHLVGLVRPVAVRIHRRRRYQLHRRHRPAFPDRHVGKARRVVAGRVPQPVVRIRPGHRVAHLHVRVGGQHRARQGQGQPRAGERRRTAQRHRPLDPVPRLLHRERPVRQRRRRPQRLAEHHLQRRAGHHRARHRRTHPVHLVVGEHADRRVPELQGRRLVPRRVRDRAAVQLQRVPGDGNAVGVRITLRHRVAEHQRRRAAARVVHRVLHRSPQRERDARPRHRSAGRGHRHRLGERRGDIDRGADRVGAIRPRRRGHRDRIGLNQRRRGSVHLVGRVVVHRGEVQIRVLLRLRRADAHPLAHAQLVRVERDALRGLVVDHHGPGELERRRVRPAPAGVEGHGLLAPLRRVEIQLQHRAAHHVHRRVERHPRAHHVAHLVGVLPRGRRRHQLDSAHRRQRAALTRGGPAALALGVLRPHLHPVGGCRVELLDRRRRRRTHMVVAAVLAGLDPIRLVVRVGAALEPAYVVVRERRLAGHVRRRPAHLHAARRARHRRRRRRRRRLIIVRHGDGQIVRRVHGGVRAACGILAVVHLNGDRVARLRFVVQRRAGRHRDPAVAVDGERFVVGAVARQRIGQGVFVGVGGRRHRAHRRVRGAVLGHAERRRGIRREARRDVARLGADVVPPAVIAVVLALDTHPVVGVRLQGDAGPGTEDRVTSRGRCLNPLDKLLSVSESVSNRRAEVKMHISSSGRRLQGDGDRRRGRRYRTDPVLGSHG